jgi:hypothetical protein
MTRPLVRIPAFDPNADWRRQQRRFPEVDRPLQAKHEMTLLTFLIVR